MVAALRSGSCLFSPAPPPPSSHRCSLLPAGRPLCEQQQRFPCLKTPQPGGKGRLFVARTQSRDVSSPRRHFDEQMELVSDHYEEIISIDNGFLYVEATAMSAQVCISVNQALTAASDVVDSAGLAHGAPHEISMETTRASVRVYANIFSDAAEAAYRRTVNRRTVVSFLRALAGLAAVSHILLQDALEAVAGRFLGDGLHGYLRNADVKDMYGELKQLMGELEQNALNSSDMEMCKVAAPTIVEATEATASFVGLVVARRQEALEKAQTKLALEDTWLIEC